MSGGHTWLGGGDSGLGAYITPPPMRLKPLALLPPMKISVGHEPRGWLEPARLVRGVGSSRLDFGKPARDKLEKYVSPGNWLDYL
jgi:hypothetical protein